MELLTKNSLKIHNVYCSASRLQQDGAIDDDTRCLQLLRRMLRNEISKRPSDRQLSVVADLQNDFCQFFQKRPMDVLQDTLMCRTRDPAFYRATLAFLADLLFNGNITAQVVRTF